MHKPRTYSSDMDPSIILDYIPKQLLPSLGISLVELLPDLCLGWWTPPSMNFNKYNRLKYLRILLLIVAWYPVFELLFSIIDSTLYSATVIFALASIVVRPFSMEKQIKRVTSIGLWNAVLPKEKREAWWIVDTNLKPWDINKFDELAARYINYPTTKVAGVVMAIIKNILPKGNYSQWEIFAAILIQNRWRSYAEQKKFRATKSSLSNVTSQVKPPSLKEVGTECFFAAVLIQNRWRSYTKQKKIRATKSSISNLKSQKEPPSLKELGTECSRLLTRLSQLPKFSPEWTLVKVELRLVTEEMEYFYEQSLNEECKAMSN